LRKPDTHGGIHRLTIDFNTDEIERFKLLLRAVWHHIQKLEFPDTSAYEQSYKGILAFEADLIDQATKK